MLVKLQLDCVPPRSFVDLRTDHATAIPDLLPVELQFVVNNLGGHASAWPIYWLPTDEAFEDDLERIPICYWCTPAVVSDESNTWRLFQGCRGIPLFQGESRYYAWTPENRTYVSDLLDDPPDSPEYLLESFLSRIYVCWDEALEDIEPENHELVLAACQGHTSHVIEHLKRHDIDAPLRKDGASLLYFACEYNQLDLARALLDAGANADHPIVLDSLHGKGLSTILVSVVRTGICREIARLLLECGADPNPPTPKNRALFDKNFNGVEVYSHDLKELLVEFGHKVTP